MSDVLSPAPRAATNGGRHEAISTAPAAFHPAVSTWFGRRFPEGPSDPQRHGWPLIASGADTLIAAPTGSGKTLAGFLTAIDSAYKANETSGTSQDIASSTRLVYVSPLKALATDIHQNLERPLREIAEVASELGYQPAPITVAVRTGDTTSSARAAMLRKPPTFLVTTPESLYLLVTAERSRKMLAGVETVIVDEIHSLARDKRGSHLALTLARLEHVVGRGMQRIGLSATQKPIEETARLLCGADRQAQIVDCGHARDVRVRMELPGSELGAVASTEQFTEIVERIAKHVAGHRTTLVFVNTRRMSERLAHLLGERLGPDQVAAHHGSLSVDRRQRTETRLRAGELRALVATASLELGIDIGPVELVCQVGSPRSIATMLQRVGRSNHWRGGTPEGILYPLTRDDMVECAALMSALRASRLDATHMPIAPLDILAQQIVAEVASAGEWAEDALFELVRKAAPYSELARDDFDEVIELASEGISTGRGKALSYLHRDRVNKVLRPRRAARLAALTSGGAIAETGDYRVVAEPEDTTVGSVNEDFAIESMVGDVFLLGTHSWRIRRVSGAEVRVVDAEGADPTIPFWLGEAPGRSDELSDEVSALRRAVSELLDGSEARRAVEHVGERCGLHEDAATAVVDYLSTAKGELGVLPTRTDIVFERFFDEAGGMQLVVHAPYGARTNRALGLALRKRFCATFDFELQAAADDDNVLLSLGPQHSFPLSQAPGLLHSQRAEEILRQAVLVSPMFTSRWRWNLNRSLAILRIRGGRKNPLPIQRMEADDLMAAVFPALAACQENAPAGPVAIPDHVIVRQTLHDCLHEAMDVEGLVRLLRDMEESRVDVHFVESTQPSVLAHEILNGKPFTFLDDAPLEERRSRAVSLQRGLGVELRPLGALDGAAIERVRAEAAPDPRNAEELHDLLASLVVARPEECWRAWFDELVDAGRAMSVVVRDATDTASFWCALERRPYVESLYGALRHGSASFEPDISVPASLSPAEPIDGDLAVSEAVRGHLDVSGPATSIEIAQRIGVPPTRVEVGLARLQDEGFAMRGRFDPDAGLGAHPDAGLDAHSDAGIAVQWCARRLLARIHAHTRSRLRREIEPVSPADFMRFLLRWQHVAPGTQLQGRAGVLAVVDQLQGFEIAAGAWEPWVLSGRIEHYQSAWLEDLCRSGDATWVRPSVRADDGEPDRRRGTSTPSRSTPITFTLREDLTWLLAAARGDAVPAEPAHGPSREVLDALSSNGALFGSELRSITKRLPTEIEEGIWDLVARGLVTADGFQAVRSLLSGRSSRRARSASRAWQGVGGGTTAPASLRAPYRRTGRRSLHQDGGGRWSLVSRTVSPQHDPHELAEAVAGQLLARWGVVFYDLLARETIALPWRNILWALRRFEARGIARGGRFVTGVAGEQYALAEAVAELRSLRGHEPAGELVLLNATDPLNVVGIVVPGPRVPAVRTNKVAYRDGRFVDARPVVAADPGSIVAADARSIVAADARSIAADGIRSEGGRLGH